MANIHNLIPPFKKEGPRKLTNKQLRWLINNPPPTPILVEITPGLAEEMLTYNQSNRPKRPGHITKLSRMMQKGFPQIFEPLVFSDAAKLRQGQHRLFACVDSDCTFIAWVAFGDLDANFAFMDIGATRGPSDIFAIHGVPNATNSAAITRAVATYDRAQLQGKGGGFAQFDGPDEVYRAYLDLGTDDVQESCRISLMLGHNRISYPTMLAAMHFVCARKSRSVADDFFRKIATGIGFQSTRDHARKIREHLVRDELTRIGAAGDVITAWNHMRQRKAIRQWFSDVGGSFPRAV